MKRSILVLVAMLSLCQIAHAQANYYANSPSGHYLGYELRYAENCAVVCDMDTVFGPSTGNLIIPTSIIDYYSNEFTVIGISSHAFHGDTGLTSVTMPSTIKSIGDYAFAGCTGLSSITIPDSVTSIGNHAFYGCSFTQPVYHDTFFCFLPRNYSGSYTIPNGITRIIGGAIEDCPSLTSVILPNSVMECNSNFSGCVNLNSIIRNDHLFVYLPRNHSGNYSIPTGISTISRYAFKDCEGLTEVTIPRTVTQIPALYLTFAGCSNLSTVNYFADSANCPNFSSFDLYRSGDSLRANHINIGNSVKMIPDGLFAQSTEITRVVIPNSVETIGSYAFCGCYNLHNIEFSDSLKLISYYAFQFCWSLDTVILPNSLSYFGSGAFSLSGISYINIPMNICRTINVDGWGCPNLRGIKIETKRLVASGSFSNTIYHIYVGDSVELLPGNIFNGCTCVQDITLSCTNPPTIQPSTFAGISPNIPIEVPCGTADAYREAPYWNTFTNFVETACPELCMVGVENGRNVLYWNNDQEVAAYNLYRESVVAGEYELMATVPYDSASRWVDVNSRPRTRSYRYKISTIDADSNESSLSHEQKTMHLTINQGLGGRWNLQWTPYEGAEYTTYIIYRGTTLDSLVQIDIMPADGNTSYTDEEAPEGDVFYQVGIVMRNSCSSATKSASISRSNIATNSSVGINDVADVSFNIYSHGNQIVINGTNGETVRVFDMMGRMVAITNGNTVSVPTTGVYIVIIGNLPARRMAVIW